MKAFISYPHDERETVLELASLLEENEIDVFFDGKIKPGELWDQRLSEELANSDVVIMVYSDKQLSTNSIIELYNAMTRLQSSKDGKPIIIPVLIGKSYDNIPIELRKYQHVLIADRKDKSQAFGSILFAIKSIEAKQKKEAASSQEKQERLDRGINKYVEEIIKNLRETAKRQKMLAGFLYTVSAFVLLLSMAVAVYFLIKTDLSEGKLEYIAVIGIAYLFIALLVISFSKFLFTLAKSFMVEAIRCTDRIHAISFGLFYLKAFEENVTRDEVMKVFSDWNIDNGATSFRSQTSADYDPKILELVGLMPKKGS